MHKTSLLLVLSLCISISPLRADIAAIQTSALPQDAAVTAALNDVKQLEPYSEAWTSNWAFPVNKADVATRLNSDLNALTLAVKNNPQNAELALLAGLVARYAYNVDVSGSYDIAVSMLGAAQKLAPGDYRGGWFLATLKCQSSGIEAGAQQFLSIEGSHAWNSLPASFWSDYATCMLISNMPEHALRAINYLEQLHAGTAQDYASLVNIAQQRLIPYDPGKTYQTSDVWTGASGGQDTVLTSTMCGLRMHAQSNWAVNQMGISNGSCIAYFGTGPYPAVTTSLRPSILVLVQQPQANQTLEDFAKKFQTDGTFTADASLKCPAPGCIALKANQPGMYKENGDGHGRIVFLERDEPDYPGLIFEEPMAPPKNSDSQGAQYYRPPTFQERIPGKLYYLVLLDTAASIEDPAMKDYDYFLQNLIVE